MSNAIFVLIVFLLTLNKDKIYLNWPFGIKENVTFIEDSLEVRFLLISRLPFRLSSRKA